MNDNIECIILFRNTGNGNVGVISDGDNPHIFANRSEAIQCTRDHPLFVAFPYQIVELDEL